MVAAPTDNAPIEPTSNVNDESLNWIDFDDEKKVKYATEKYEDARKAFATNNIADACDKISLCLEIRATIFGEKAKEMFEPLYLNAQILLEQGRLEAGVITIAVEGLENMPIDEEDEEEKAEENDKIEGGELTAEEQEELAEKVEAALEENADCIENKKPLPTEAEESAKEGDEEADKPDVNEEKEPENTEIANEIDSPKEIDADNDQTQDETDIEDLTSYQLAYENAATARLIAEISAAEAAPDSDEFKLWSTRVADSLLLLGEISIADENYETAIDDLTTAESKQRAIYSLDDRRIAETYFQMGRCYTQWNKYDKAAEVYKKSLEVISFLKDNTQKKVEQSPDDAKLKAEAEKLDLLIIDIESWVKDSVESHIHKQQLDEEKAKENQENKPLECADNNAGDVQEIAVRKRKQVDDAEKDASDVQLEEITMKKAKLAQNDEDAEAQA